MSRIHGARARARDTTHCSDYKFPDPAFAAQQKRPLDVAQKACQQCGSRRGVLRQVVIPGYGRPLLCDLCWQAYGHGVPRSEFVEAQLEELFDSPSDATLHPLHELLTASGVAESCWRHIVPASRARLALEILDRTPPAGTRPAESDETWLEAVRTRIVGTGDFHQARSAERAWQLAQLFAACADRGRRPLTRVVQELLATTLGCTPRTVRRYVAWLRQQELLHEVVPGRELPRMATPENPTAQEKAIAELRTEMASKAEEAAIARARTELRLRNLSYPPEQAAKIAWRLYPEPEADPRLVAWDAGLPRDEFDRPVVRVAPVYELRVPLSAAELAEEAAIRRAQELLASEGEKLLRQLRIQAPEVVLDYRNAHVARDVGLDVFAAGHTGTIVRIPPELMEQAWTSGYTAGFLRLAVAELENVHPPVGIYQDQCPSTARFVEKRPASRDSDHRTQLNWADLFGVPAEQRHTAAGSQNAALAAGKAGSEGNTRSSRAQRTAQWLFGELPPRLRHDVSIRWLAAVVRPWVLHHHWTQQDLRDQIVEGYLPTSIHNARGFIAHRFRIASPGVPPSRRAEIDIAVAEIERGRATRRQAAVAARAATRRNAIAACAFCDDNGFLDLGHDAPIVRCNHDPDTGGW